MAILRKKRTKIILKLSGPTFKTRIPIIVFFGIVVDIIIFKINVSIF